VIVEFGVDEHWSPKWTRIDIAILIAVESDVGSLINSHINLINLFSQLAAQHTYN